MSIFNRKKKRIAELEAKLDETEMSLDKLNGAIEDVLWFQGHDVFLRGLIAYVGETESPVGRPPELRRKERENNGKANNDHLRQMREEPSGRSVYSNIYRNRERRKDSQTAVGMALHEMLA